MEAPTVSKAVSTVGSAFNWKTILFTTILTIIVTLIVSMVVKQVIVLPDGTKGELKPELKLKLQKNS